MRRAALLLSLLTAATAAAIAPAAHAQQDCVVVWTDGTVVPNVTVPFCAGVPINTAQDCGVTEAGVEPEGGVHVGHCIPIPG
jgi:ABC-type sugar transport system substrate-binding protein